MIAIGTCTLAALNGTTVILIKHLIDSDQFFLSFINWWFGDTLGVLIFTPLVLVSLDKSAVWNGRRWHIGTTLIIGMLFCAVIQHTMKDSDEQELISRFQSDSITMLNKFKLLEQTQLQTLTDLTALFDASDNVTAKEFNTFSQRVVNKKDVLRAWGWVPLIRQTEAKLYSKITSEALHRSFGITVFNDWPPNSNGWAAPRNLY